MQGERGVRCSFCFPSWTTVFQRTGAPGTRGRPKGAVRALGGAAKPPCETCPGSEEPSLCKEALSVPVWPQSFKSSLCCAQTCISMTSVQGPNVPLGATQTILAPLLPGSLSTYLKKDINPRLPTSFQSYCQNSAPDRVSSDLCMGLYSLHF